MHDLSFFLLKNLLPVGLVAIVFFSIGLLLAKFIWGRFTQRLSYAIEENLNLASQWSALGASQRDLFKKLRVRWQSDRDVFETTLAERDAKISSLVQQFRSSGREVTLSASPDPALLSRLAELEGTLRQEKESKERLARELEEKSRREEPSFLAAVTGGDAPETALQARIKDLEQDLIDTHDELHDLRLGYQKQLKLVESFEARLIGMPAVDSSALAGMAEKLSESERIAESRASEIAQLKALLPQRSREILSLSGRISGIRKNTVEKGLFESETSKLSADRAELNAVAEGLRNELEMSRLALVDLEEKSKSEHDSSLGEIAKLTEALELKSGELEEAREKLANLEILSRRKASLQSELNDAFHELYDVRRALNAKSEVILTLEARQEVLSSLEVEKSNLESTLESTRADLAATLKSLSDSKEAASDATEELADLRNSYNTKVAESEAVSAELLKTRHELSDVKIAYAAKVEEFETARAQMEELEAIIGDRTAEVNDLSTELRAQRDQVRLLKNSLAETEGEMEALTDESRVLNAGVDARNAFLAEQKLRITDLELALSERYKEMNSVRIGAEEHAKNARYFEAQAAQLGAELDRRSDEFLASDQRVATAEEAIDAANLRIAELTEQLEVSGQSIGQLQDELNEVSRSKDETIRNLEKATRRIEQLEEAARTREEQVSQLDAAYFESQQVSKDLDRRLERITLELESAREEQQVSRTSISELEDALRASDGRTLELSDQLDAKEQEVDQLLAALESLKTEVKSSEAKYVESRSELEGLKTELDDRIAAARAEVGEDHVTTLDESRKQAAEIESLREEIREKTEKLESEVESRRESLAEIGRLQEKVEDRSELIRDLQGQVNGIMLQRASRDNEIHQLKEKLESVEKHLEREVEARKEEARLAREASEEALSVDPVSLAAAIEESLASGKREGETISLDELVATGAHHPPVQESEAVVPVPKAVDPVAIPEDDRTVYFDESAFQLSEEEIRKIDQCAREIRRFGRKAEVTLVGYAGSEGSSDFSEGLSARRADAVRERLLERGVPQSVVKVKGAGRDRRFSDWKARRVDMIVAPVAVAETVN
jgi:chromosome segregation ATPase